MGYFLMIAMGYLLGSSSMTYYLGKLKNIDVRNHGTGNLGASNAAVTMGWGAAVLVAVHDIGKGLVAVWLAKFFFPELALVGELTGVACVMGHMYPFYLGFKGGKGLASFIGVTGGLHFPLAWAAGALLIAVTILSDYIALGTLSVVVAVPVALWLLTGDFVGPGVLLIASAVMAWKHRDNIKRILAGEEIGLRRTMKGKDRVK